MTDKRKDCLMRHENGNCNVIGRFCTAVNDPICAGLHNAYDCGYCDGETRAKRQKEHPQWISVKDRLPDYMGEVLVIVSGKPHENITLDGAYEIAEYDPVEGWILEMWPEWCSGVVTHWMPLPEPPEEDEAK